MTYAEVEEKALGLLRQFWEARGKPKASAFFPVDAEALVESVLGWQCEAKDMVAIDPTMPGLHVLGRCTVSKSGGGLVEVATTAVGLGGPWSNAAIQRWTWAHEAGHVALGHVGTKEGQHYECRRVRSAVRGKPTQHRGPQEFTADAFARALLMPERAVRKQFKARFGVERVWAVPSAYRNLLGRYPPEPSGPSPENLAELLVTHSEGSAPCLSDFFGVSRDAARRRLMELGIVFA